MSKTNSLPIACLSFRLSRSLNSYNLYLSQSGKIQGVDPINITFSQFLVRQSLYYSYFIGDNINSTWAK